MPNWTDDCGNYTGPSACEHKRWKDDCTICADYDKFRKMIVARDAKISSLARENRELKAELSKYRAKYVK
jgi:hypothetical protein